MTEEREHLLLFDELVDIGGDCKSIHTNPYLSNASKVARHVVDDKGVRLDHYSKNGP
jgi:hypothetical protein